MRGYVATVDSPGCDIYQDLMTLYPNAKVVLSVRDSDEAWWKSFSSTLGVQATKRYEWLTYPIPFLRANEILFHRITGRWKRLAGTDTLGPDIHRAHNEGVRSNVPREKLLVFNVKMGWKPLCEFLNVPVPEQPFPNMSVLSLQHPCLRVFTENGGFCRNDAKMISKILVGAQLMGACVWLLYLTSAALLTLLIIWPHRSLSLFTSFVGRFGTR